MKRLGCKKVRDTIIAQLKTETENFVKEGNKAPGLAVILVGENPASQTYVRKKQESCEELGFLHFDYRFREDAGEDEILALIDRLNGDDEVDGILVQLPLPKHISEQRVIRRISPEKDVDGFSPYNVGLLSIGEDAFVPCTPLGILETLRYYGIGTAGKKCVMIGRSNIVGKPMAQLLMQKGVDATVTVCNTKTPDITEFTRDADIVIVATGHPGTLDASMVRSDAVVIDVGVNRIADPTREKGFRLVGDVDYPSFAETGCSVTPVPGGVGLMTVAMLMKNTLKSAHRRRK